MLGLEIRSRAELVICIILYSCFFFSGIYNITIHNSAYCPQILPLYFRFLSILDRQHRRHELIMGKSYSQMCEQHS
jgi:hypothetical protein